MNVAATRVSGVSAAAAERVSAFLRAVYGWMCVGLGVTAVVAYAITASAAVVQTIASNHLLFLGALAVELGLVFYLSARVQSLAPNAAMLLFLLYSGLNGVTLSVVRSWSPPGCSGRSLRSARRRSVVWPARDSSSSWGSSA